MQASSSRRRARPSPFLASAIVESSSSSLYFVCFVSVPPSVRHASVVVGRLISLSEKMQHIPRPICAWTVCARCATWLAPLRLRRCAQAAAGMSTF